MKLFKFTFFLWNNSAAAAQLQWMGRPLFVLIGLLAPLLTKCAKLALREKSTDKWLVLAIRLLIKGIDIRPENHPYTSLKVEPSLSAGGLRGWNIYLAVKTFQIKVLGWKYLVGSRCATFDCIPHRELNTSRPCPGPLVQHNAMELLRTFPTSDMRLHFCRISLSVMS